MTASRHVRIGNRCGWLCALCRQAVDQMLRWPDPCSPSTEHVIPLSQGGTDDPVNLAIAHLACNVVSNDRADHALCERTADHFERGTCRPVLGAALPLAESVRRWCAEAQGPTLRRIAAERRGEISALYGVIGISDAELEAAELAVIARQAEWLELVESGRGRHRAGPAWYLGEAGAAARGPNGESWQRAAATP